MVILLSKRLKKLRKERKLSQKKLAKELNLSPSTIAMYETNKRNPDSETLEKMSDLFNVSIDYLLGLTDERSSADKIKKALTDDPELSDAWEKISKREDLQLLFKQTKDMDESSIRQVIRIIKAIEDEESNN